MLSQSSETWKLGSTRPIDSAVVVDASPTGASSESVVYAQCIEGLQDVVFAYVRRPCDLRDGRSSTQVLPHRRHGAIDDDRGLLDVPRDTERPSAIAEVPLQLTHDRGRRVGRERPRSGSYRSIAFNRPKEAVWVRSSTGSPAREASSEVLGEREELRGERIPGGRLGQSTEELHDLLVG